MSGDRIHILYGGDAIISGDVIIIAKDGHNLFRIDFAKSEMHYSYLEYRALIKWKYSDTPPNEDNQMEVYMYGMWGKKYIIPYIAEKNWVDGDVLAMLILEDKLRECVGFRITENIDGSIQPKAPNQLGIQAGTSSNERVYYLVYQDCIDYYTNWSVNYSLSITEYDPVFRFDVSGTIQEQLERLTNLVRPSRFIILDRNNLPVKIDESAAQKVLGLWDRRQEDPKISYEILRVLKGAAKKATKDGDIISVNGNLLYVIDQEHGLIPVDDKKHSNDLLLIDNQLLYVETARDERGREFDITIIWFSGNVIKFVEGWKPRRDPIFSIEEIAITDGEHIRESKYILSSNHMKIHQFRDLIDGNFQELSVHFPPMWVEAFAATDEDAEMALALL